MAPWVAWSKLKFSISLIRLISSFLSQRKFRVLVESEMPTSRDIQPRVPQGSVLSPTVYSIYKWYAPDTCLSLNISQPYGPPWPGTGIALPFLPFFLSVVYLGLLADDTCIYTTDRKDGYILRKLHRGLSAIEMWCECWNIKTNEDKDSGHLPFS
jgi:hypothetical protein